MHLAMEVNIQNLHKYFSATCHVCSLINVMHINVLEASISLSAENSALGTASVCGNAESIKIIFKKLLRFTEEYVHNSC
jgi:hypothetical protein